MKFGIYVVYMLCLCGALGTDPTTKPTLDPTAKPTLTPTNNPTTKPTRDPTIAPTRAPSTIAPTEKPIATPTVIPTAAPSIQPTSMPTVTIKPTPLPSSQPSSGPSSQPSSSPSTQPSSTPTSQPSAQPSFAPTSPTGQPTSAPQNPSIAPTEEPTYKPTWSLRPSRSPTLSPTCSPSIKPTYVPTRTPTPQPTRLPTVPTSQPSSQPSKQPSRQPSSRPTGQPTTSPTSPTSQPSRQPSRQPTAQPSNWPSSQPSTSPSKLPVPKPTPVPSSNRPSYLPTSQPSGTPSSQPSSRPSGEPTQFTTHPPTKHYVPSSQPTRRPSSQPSSSPSKVPSAQPTMMPSSPTSQPSSTPSTQPSGQPSSRPSVQPSGQPSLQPSSQPTFTPTSPTSQPSTTPSVRPSPKPTPSPTLFAEPSSQPSSQPSQAPSGQPSSFPTVNPTLSYFPTSHPTKLPTPAPTAQPTFYGGIPYTLRPTAFYETVSVEGTVEFVPDSAAACNPVQMHMTFTFSKDLAAGGTIFISTPGMTSGPCYNASDGYDIDSLYIPNTGDFQVSYHEGSYLDNYASSSMSFVIGSSGVDALTTYTVYIDRANKIRRSCSMNTSWEVTIIPNNGRIAGRVGTISLIETYPKRCFVFYSSLYFPNAVPQFYTGVNATLRLGYEITAGTTITLHLPGFTNSVGGYPLNVLQGNFSAFDAPRNGYDATLYDVTSSTNFTWAAQWIEGSYVDNFAGSQIILTAYGYQAFNDLFWVLIPKSRNHIVPVCGHPPDDSNLMISTKSDFFYINATAVGTSSVIGPGCGALNKCSDNGVCDYCTSTCTCNEGYGSVEDRAVSIADDFLPDCSSKACPAGPSLGNLATHSVRPTGDTFVLTDDNHMHRLMECSNNGICNRKSGKCKCAKGFEGAACQKMKCGGLPMCSGRGKCMQMDRLSRSLEAVPLSTRRVSYASQNESRMESWDTQLGHACVCDSSWAVGLLDGQTQLAEFFGPACESRRCPSGDDPNTRTVDETDCEGIAQTGGDLDYREKGHYGNKCHIDCSNRGTCNYRTGVCACYQGFTGDNCGSYVP